MAGFHRPGRRLVRSARSAWQRFSFCGIVREACLEYVPGTPIGRYVPVPAGLALGRIDEAEASVHTQALKDPDRLTELESPANEEVGSEENRR